MLAKSWKLGPHDVNHFLPHSRLGNRAPAEMGLRSSCKPYWGHDPNTVIAIRPSDRQQSVIRHLRIRPTTSQADVRVGVAVLSGKICRMGLATKLPHTAGDNLVPGSSFLSIACERGQWRVPTIAIGGYQKLGLIVSPA